MKHLIVFMIGALITAPSFAKLIDLSVRNNSDQNIVIERVDGTKLTVLAHTIIPSSFFEDKSEVKNYVAGKYVCSWHIDSHPAADMTMDGIGYINGYNNKWECVEYFLQG